MNVGFSKEEHCVCGYGVVLVIEIMRVEGSVSVLHFKHSV